MEAYEIWLDCVEMAADEEAKLPHVIIVYAVLLIKISQVVFHSIYFIKLAI